MVNKQKINWVKLLGDTKVWVATIKQTVDKADPAVHNDYVKRYVRDGVDTFEKYINLQYEFYDPLHHDVNEDKHVADYSVGNALDYARRYGARLLSKAERLIIEKMMHIVNFFESNKEVTKIFSCTAFAKFSKRTGREFMALKAKVESTYELGVTTISNIIAGDVLIEW